MEDDAFKDTPPAIYQLSVLRSKDSSRRMMRQSAYTGWYSNQGKNTNPGMRGRYRRQGVGRRRWMTDPRTGFLDLKRVC
ncbi:hypothetical protein ANTQUA_LOCUS9454 [Anthophora quadrimaculata]